MEQGNYKTLFLKLSGAAVGLVAMLSLAITLGQNQISVENSSISSPENYTQEDLDVRRALNRQFNIVVEPSIELGMVVVNEAQLNAEKLKIEHVKKRLIVKSKMVEQLSYAIEKIVHQVSIPMAIKEEILADLQRSLADNDKALNELERNMADLSYVISLSSLQYKDASKCSKEIIIETCDDQCQKNEAILEGEDPVDGNARGKNTGSLEKFSWI
ncbi:MAG: hypothetical protein JKY45_09035 [Emcibacter sp.]|nr:hypothetical protein [Emcibacter sp.]